MIWSVHSCKLVITMCGLKVAIWEKVWPTIIEIESCSSYRWFQSPCKSYEVLPKGKGSQWNFFCCILCLHGFRELMQFFIFLIFLTRELCIVGAGIVWINQEKIKCAIGVCIWFLWSKHGDLLLLHPNTRSTRANIEESLTHDGMWCLTPHGCWSQSVQNTTVVTYFQIALSIEERFSCVVGQHKGIHARSKGGNVDMAHQCQLSEV